MPDQLDYMQVMPVVVLTLYVAQTLNSIHTNGHICDQRSIAQQLRPS